MNVKQQPFDILKPVVKTDPEENISKSQTTGEFVNDDGIKQEIIKCEEPKVGHQYSDLQPKIDHDSVSENLQFFPSTIKKELENFNDVKTTYFKQEVDPYYRQSTTETLTTCCDLQILNNESADYPDHFKKPSSSKQPKKTLKRSNNTSKVLSKKRRYSCLVCQKNFPSSKSRSKHIDGHFQARFIACLFCGKLMTKIDFLQHNFIHMVKNGTRKSQNINTELKQNLIIKLKSNLQKHLLIRSNEKAYKCDICNREFQMNSYLQDHLKVHTQEKIFKCFICSQKFNNKYDLWPHILIHQNEKSINCDICSKNFQGKCDICSKEFNQRISSLLKYLKIKSNENSVFKCDICSKEFRKKSMLQSHLIVHTNEKPFECDICFRKFNRKGNMICHFKLHTNGKPFTPYNSIQVHQSFKNRKLIYSDI